MLPGPVDQFAGAQEEVRRGHDQAAYHDADHAEGEPPRAMAPASVVVEHDWEEDLADLVAGHHQPFAGEKQFLDH